MSSKKVLVVDDEPHVCKVLRELLEFMGYRSVEAHSGDEAVELFSRERPDLVLLDIRMPGKDGIQTLKELKTIDPEAGVFMVTAILDEDVVEQAIREGAFEYITKPINPYSLELKIRRWLQRNFITCK